MLYTEKYCDDYFSNFIPLSPVYCWGFNIENVKQSPNPYQKFVDAYNSYGSETGKYNQAYYNMKYQQAMSGSGWVSDCSGFLYALRNEDMTANGYYWDCVAAGPISSMDLRHSCLVFRGTSENTIKHVGYYNASNGQVQEMANSEKNFQSKPFNANNWDYWGKPSFMDYSSSLSPVVNKPYLYKGIDISVYQKNVNYASLKTAGVDFAILKIINKQLNKDTMFETHYSGCQNSGIKVYAVYNYSYALGADEARRDANAVISALEGRKIPVSLDLENQLQTLIGHTIVDVINAYQQVIESKGLPFILYTGLSFYNTYIKPYASELSVKNLWIARYYKSDTPMQYVEDPDQHYKPMDGILGWQYTSSGQVLGITGDVDLDIIYREMDAPVSVPVAMPSQPSNLPQINSQIKNVVRTNGDRLNIRNKPNTSGGIIGHFNNGQEIIIVGVDKVSGWYRLSVTQDMWCSNEWVQSSGKGIITAEKSLYIRSSDSKNGEIWGTYKNGDIVTILHQSGTTGWYLTPKGWISNNFVSLE